MADPSGSPGRELEEVGIVDVNVGWTSCPPTAGPSVDGQRLYTVGGHTALDIGFFSQNRWHGLCVDLLCAQMAS